MIEHGCFFQYKSKLPGYGCVLVDTGASQPIGSAEAVDSFAQAAKEFTGIKSKLVKSCSVYRFANANTEKPGYAVFLPYKRNGVKGVLKVDRLIPKQGRHTPILVGIDFLKSVQIDLKFSTMTWTSKLLKVTNAPIKRNSMGHMYLNLLTDSLSLDSETEVNLVVESHEAEVAADSSTDSEFRFCNEEAYPGWIDEHGNRIRAPRKRRRFGAPGSEHSGSGDDEADRSQRLVQRSQKRRRDLGGAPAGLQWPPTKIKPSKGDRLSGSKPWKIRDPFRFPASPVRSEFLKEAGNPGRRNWWSDDELFPELPIIRETDPAGSWSADEPDPRASGSKDPPRRLRTDNVPSSRLPVVVVSESDSESRQDAARRNLPILPLGANVSDNSSDSDRVLSKTDSNIIRSNVSPKAVPKEKPMVRRLPTPKPKPKPKGKISPTILRDIPPAQDNVTPYRIDTGVDPTVAHGLDLSHTVPTEIGARFLKGLLDKTDAHKRLHNVLGHRPTKVVRLLKCAGVSADFIRKFEDYASRCEFCKEYAPKPRVPKSLGHFATQPLEYVGCDFFEIKIPYTFPVVRKVTQKWFHLIDLFSRFESCYPVTHETSLEAADCLMKFMETW